MSVSTLQFPLPIQGVIVDLDGTMLDTIADLTVATNQMLVVLGEQPLPESVVRTFVGKGLRRLVERALARSVDGVAEAMAVTAAMPIFERCYAAVNGTQTQIYPGVVAGLTQLRAAGFPLACMTNKSSAFALPLLARQDLAEFFSITVCGDTLPQKKPDPRPLLHICEQWGLAPAQVLMVGDSMNDVQAARAAGCPIFAVPYGYTEGRAVQRHEVDAIVATLTECISLIKKV